MCRQPSAPRRGLCRHKGHFRYGHRIDGPDGTIVQQGPTGCGLGFDRRKSSSVAGNSGTGIRPRHKRPA